MIDIGCYIEAAIEWLTEEGAVFFDALNVGVESFIDSFQLALYAIPFYVFIPLTVLLVWWKVGKGMGAFTLLGLLLIWGMGFWEETMQTLALVLSSTCMALLIGIPLGIWAGKSERCNRMLRPVLDCMQTMPAFVSDWVRFPVLSPPSSLPCLRWCGLRDWAYGKYLKT